MSNAIVKIKQLFFQANNDKGRNNVANTETVAAETDISDKYCLEICHRCCNLGTSRTLPSRLGKLVFLNSLSSEQWHL
jgi:hypothetical protein